MLMMDADNSALANTLEKAPLERDREGSGVNSDPCPMSSNNSGVITKEAGIGFPDVPG